MKGERIGAPPPPEGETRAFLAAHVVFARYVLFAAIAGLANLGAQALVVHGAPAWPIMISVLIGTAIGFFVKYVLEKQWVFLDDYETHAKEVRKLFVYGVSGVGTTILFWGVELGALRLWGTSEAKYIGAVLGLSLGNWIKYLLDKHYVFGKRAR